MEILNDFYTILITPNAELVNLILIPIYFFESTLILNLIMLTLNVECTMKQKIAYIIFSALIAIISSGFIPEPFNTLINYLCLFLLNKQIFKLNIIKTLLSIILPTVTFSLVGLLTLNPYLNIFNISYENIMNVPIHRFLYLTVYYIIITFILIILKYKDFNIQLLDNIDSKNKTLIIFNILLGFVTIVIQLIICYYYINTLPLLITFLSFVSLFAYFTISIYSLTRVTKLTLTTRKLQSAEEYNNTLRILHDNVRSFKHDFDNIVTTIGGYVKTNDMEGLKKYYVELEDDCQRVNNLYILNPDIVNNDGIYNLLTKKYYEADSKNIKVNITFLLDLSTLRMKIYEFARILGILLDNAIEAAEECDEKIINIIFRNDEKNSRQLIIIENTYSNKDVDTDKIFEKGVTEKEKHTGLGLWEIRKILSKNNNVNLFTSKDEKLFKQQLEIY